MHDRIEQLKKMLQAEPGDAFCMYGLALEYAKRGESDEAVSWFDRTIAADPRQCYAYFHKAKAQQEAGAMDSARETLGTGLKQARAIGDVKAASEIEAFLDELES